MIKWRIQAGSTLFVRRIAQFGFYLEYFLQDPLNIEKDFKDGGSVFCPFLERMIKEQPFLIDWEAFETDLKNNNSLETYWKIAANTLPRTRELEEKFLKDPLEIETKTDYLKFGKQIYDDWKTSIVTKVPGVTKNHTYYSLDDLKGEMEHIISDKIIGDANKKALIKERAVLIYPWARSGALNSEDIHIVGVPIASNRLFYGYVLVGFFLNKKGHKDMIQAKQDSQENDPGSANDKESERYRKDLQGLMGPQTVNFYLPALILCHHSLLEELCLKQKTISDNIPFLDTKPNNAPYKLSESNNMLERNIHKLWTIRQENKSQFKDEKFSKAHFIFKRRFWGSPKSIQKIEEALTWDMNFATDHTPEKDRLKTFLIFGGPGSGKDTLSKMIGLFSSKHTFSEPYIINMAALKPDWIAPSSLAGMTVKIDNGYPFTIDGIFKKVLDKATSDEAKKIPHNYPVIIFDELNSLDIDTQGTLLRILENAEIVPIGGIDEVTETDDAEKLLVVGVVNEVPHQLTLEDTIKSFSQDKNLWGNLLGTALYESFRGVRRLRDDLYYRFRRGGYIDLPDLDERREDIPIIFFTSLPDELRDDIVWKPSNEKIFVEYDVWDLLTDVTIQWKGNIRQLQAVTYNIARKVWKEATDGRKIKIDVPLVRGVLKEMNLLQEHGLEDVPATNS